MSAALPLELARRSGRQQANGGAKRKPGPPSGKVTRKPGRVARKELKLTRTIVLEWRTPPGNGVPLGNSDQLAIVSGSGRLPELLLIE
jgi:hypothetical protein